MVRGDVARAKGDVPGSSRLYREAVEVLEGVGSGAVPAALVGLGVALERLRRTDDARQVLSLALREAERQGAGLGLVHAALLPVAAASRDRDEFDRHMDALLAWLERTREVHPDIAEHAERAAALWGESAPERSKLARRVGREQRAVLTRAAVEAA